MRRWKRLGAAVGSLGLVLGTVGLGVNPAAAASARRDVVPGGATRAERSARVAALPARSPVRFDLVLGWRHPAELRAVVHEVSTPGSPYYHHFLSAAGFDARFAPTARSLARVEHWLRANHFRVEAAPPGRLLVEVVGSAAQVERAFRTHLGIYRVQGKDVRLASGPLTIPAGLRASVSTVAGVNEVLATATLSSSLGSPARLPVGTEHPGGNPPSPPGPPMPPSPPSPPSGPSAPSNGEPPPPTAFVPVGPCSTYWGANNSTLTAPSPYSGTVPWDTCGYTPSQLRSAYNLGHAQVATTSAVREQAPGGPGQPGGPRRPGAGRGVKIADVLWFDSPTISSDLKTYFAKKDPNNPLRPGQFQNFPPPQVANVNACGAGGAYVEQALDLEAYHAVAPAAGIQYVGAVDCTNASLITAEQQAVTHGANVISNSWAADLGDVFNDPATITAFEDVFQEAAAQGISVLFSSGDSGDNVAAFGLQIPNYPATDPYVTAVGGTSVQIGQSGSAESTYGWSSAISNQSSSGSFGPVGFYAGSGGGTSYTFPQPSYQAGVVPTDLAERNLAVNGQVPYRTVPDISMDADPFTGMLIGLTQAFPDGSDHFGTFAIGGTSLAAPLLAGAVADAELAGSGPLGFLNPTLYGEYSSLQSAGALSQVDPTNLLGTSAGNPLGTDSSTGENSPGAPQGTAVEVYSNGDSGKVITTFAAFNYEGFEAYQDGTGNVSVQNTALDTFAGYNSMTGLGTIGTGFVAALAHTAGSPTTKA